MDVKEFGYFAAGAAVGAAAVLLVKKSEARSDDEPIIIGGGSLYIAATGNHHWSQDPSDSAKLKHQSPLGDTTRRKVTSLDIISPTVSASPAVPGNHLKIELLCADGQKVTIESNPGNGLTVRFKDGTGGSFVSAAAPAFIDVGPCTITSINLPGLSPRELGGDHFFIVIHYEGFD